MYIVHRPSGAPCDLGRKIRSSNRTAVRRDRHAAARQHSRLPGHRSQRGEQLLRRAVHDLDPAADVEHHDRRVERGNDVGDLQATDRHLKITSQRRVAAHTRM
jgi:hypothetical protein